MNSVGTKNLYNKPILLDNLLLIDGITRAGKMLTAKLVSSLSGVEYLQFWAAPDHFPILWRLGLLVTPPSSVTVRCRVERMVVSNLKIQ